MTLILVNERRLHKRPDHATLKLTTPCELRPAEWHMALLADHQKGIIII